MAYINGKEILFSPSINMEYTQGVADGKKAEYDAFWDACQQNGKRLDYNNSFGGYGWTNANFLPKYDLTMGSSNNAFYYNCYEGSLKELLYKQGITLTFPNNYNMSNMFACSLFTELGVLDFTTVKQGASKMVFNQAEALHTIEKIILSNVVSMNFEDWFKRCSALENITFEGEIANDIDFRWSTKLTKASITSIVNALAGTDTNVTGKTLTLSQAAVDREFEGVSPADFTTIVPGSSSAEWYNIVTFSKPNWQIVLG